jgi:hypothetical protein
LNSCSFYNINGLAIIEFNFQVGRAVSRIAVGV